jgi:DNA-binding NtrC family response regulator
MLSGQTILVVEEEFLIALDIQRVLEDHDAGQCVFARSITEALALRDRWIGYGLAIIELQANHTDGLELLAGLQTAGIALVVTTADLSLRSGLPGVPGIQVLIKPFPEAELVSAIKEALATANQNE